MIKYSCKASLPDKTIFFGYIMDNFDYIKRNFEELNAELIGIASRCGVAVPTLVSVTKSGSDEELLALAAAGARDIGENRPGEVKRRGELLTLAGYDVNMHEIGTLQRNKVKLIVNNAALIHSVDTLKLASDINRLAGNVGRKIPVLIEINSAEEENKSGVMPSDAEALLNGVLEFENLELCGLMTMGPVCDNPEDIRKYFRLTKKLFDLFSTNYGFGEFPILSMGMSDSYEVAIEEGSTLVRVGRKLFIK